MNINGVAMDYDCSGLRTGIPGVQHHGVRLVIRVTIPEIFHTRVLEGNP